MFGISLLLFLSLSALVKCEIFTNPIRVRAAILIENKLVQILKSLSIQEGSILERHIQA